MHTTLTSLSTSAALIGALACLGCGGSTASDSDGGLLLSGDQQTPPQGTDEAITAWLATGNYKGTGWKCEAAGHDARSPSPHMRNRICNNTKLTQTASGLYPVGAASVKELLAADGGTQIVGYAIGLKLTAGTSTGAGWYWYEKMGAVVANGRGDKAGNETTLCTGCHQGAGSDAAHSGRDFVYTQVP
jgi:hypothetical protein